MALHLEEYLPALDDVPVTRQGQPLRLPIEFVDEDPAQPRLDFDADSLAELARTIAARGVRQPISVRRNPISPDRWLLNFGARRLRASRLAGRTEIPAFIDETADSYDQVIENEHRQALRPLDLALFVERQLKAGQTKADVARRLGKSAAYLTYVCALIDAPDWLLDLYRSGRCRGVRELYEARLLGESDPDAIRQMSETSKTIARVELVARRRQSQAGGRAGRDGCSAPGRSAPPGDSPDESMLVDQEDSQSPRATHEAGPVEIAQGRRPADLSVSDELRIMCRVHGRQARVILSPVHPDHGRVFVYFDGESSSDEVRLEDISALKLERER